MRSYSNNGGFIGRTFNINDEDYFINIGSAPEAIQYVGGTTASFVGSTTNDTVSLTSLTGGIASEPQYGDLIIVAVELCGTTNKAYRIANFTQIADLYQNDTEDSNFQVGYKLTSIVPETSVVITGGSGSTADGIAVAVHVYRNIDQVTPFDVTRTTAGALNGAIPNPPAITPVTSGALIVVAAGAAHDATAAGLFTASYLSNFITDTTVALAETNDATVGMGNVEWSSGAYDPAAWTFTGTGGTTGNWSYNSVTMALRPGPTVTLGNKRNSGILDLPGQISPKLLNVTGQQEYITAAGTFSFTVPENVFKVSAVTIGGGGGGSGGDGGRGETNNGGGGGGVAWGTIDVIPGETLTVIVGTGGSTANGGAGGAGGTSNISRGATVLLSGSGGAGGAERTTGTAAGGTSTGTARSGGGSGGNGGTGGGGGGGTGGGGAGGYTANGGNGGARASSGSDGAGGGGGGGSGYAGTTAGVAGGGGGIGIYGTGSNGVGGAAGNGNGGGGGSGGNNGATNSTVADGLFGGGGGGRTDSSGTGSAGGRGAVRIVWGNEYSFENNAPSGITATIAQAGIVFFPQIDQY